METSYYDIQYLRDTLKEAYDADDIEDVRDELYEAFKVCETLLNSANSSTN